MAGRDESARLLRHGAARALKYRQNAEQCRARAQKFAEIKNSADIVMSLLQTAMTWDIMAQCEEERVNKVSLEVIQNLQEELREMKYKLRDTTEELERYRARLEAMEILPRCATCENWNEKKNVKCPITEYLKEEKKDDKDT